MQIQEEMKKNKRGGEIKKKRDADTRLYRNGKPIKKSLCHYMEDKGYCRNGDNCTWAHSKKELEDREALAHWYDEEERKERRRREDTGGWR